MLQRPAGSVPVAVAVTIASRGFTTGKTGSRTDLDKLEIRAGYRVAGRVVLSDGKPIPAKTRIFIGREDAWDHAETMLGSGFFGH